MTQATEAAVAGRGSDDTRLIAAVNGAHFVSHYYMLLLPPLFDFVRADYGVSYTELGFAIAVFNGVAAAAQTPTGFLTDWLGARVLLIGGLLLGACAVALAGLVDSFWFLVAMFGVLGLANTVYHPADYAMLSHHVAPARLARAFSIHTFSGILGYALAPASLLLMQTMWGWRGAFLGASVIGFAAAAGLLAHRGDAPVHAAAAKPQAADAGPVGWRLLLSAPILLSLAFFLMLALVNTGLSNYVVVALGALHGTPASTANSALSAYLFMSAVGVLGGGWLAARTSRHGAVAGGGLAMVAVLAVILASFDLRGIALGLVMAVGGFFVGVIMPSRDLIVRAITPAGSFGKVFGFVTTGFNIGGIIAPLMFGAVMDHGSPRLLFLLVALFAAVAILTVAVRPARLAQAPPA
jgi:MFS family permease